MYSVKELQPEKMESSWHFVFVWVACGGAIDESELCMCQDSLSWCSNLGGQWNGYLRDHDVEAV